MLSQQTDAQIKAMARENARKAIEEEPDRWVPVIPVDFILHDESHPFCDDMGCPCRFNQEVKRQIHFQVEDGLLTRVEMFRILDGVQL